MSLMDEIFSEPELRDRPPVLVDVGAAGGIHEPWRCIARYSIGVGFEPDTRETAALSEAQRLFKRWIFVPGLASPTEPSDGELPFHLTRSPQCSSVLSPIPESVGEWAFAELFDVVEKRNVPATSLLRGLSGQGVEQVDWLKCDSQGMDLRLFQSLPEAWRRRMLLVEFEPGLIDVYRGEDKLSAVLASMSAEPFWISEFNVQRTQRGRPALLRQFLGERQASWFGRFGQTAPGWVNITYLRDFEQCVPALDRRSHLLAWVFAGLQRQPAAALAIAAAGEARFRDDVFARMVRANVAGMRRSMLRGFARAVIRRLRFR